MGKEVLFKSSLVGCGTAQLLMTSLAIGQISLDVRTRNECFSVHYLCKLETKHPQQLEYGMETLFSEETLPFLALLYFGSSLKM